MRKFLALLLFIILVFPLLFAAQVTAGVSSWVLDRDFYLDAFDQPEVYETLTHGPFVKQMLQENLYIPDSFDTANLAMVIPALVTPEYAKSQIDYFINGYFDYLQGKTNEFSPALELEPLKQSLLGPNQDQLLKTIVSSIPACVPGQAPSIGNLSDFCKPVDDSDELLIQYFIKPSLPVLVDTIPNELMLDEIVPGWDTILNWHTIIPGMAVPASLILGVIAIAFVAIVAWYITALISDRSWHQRLQWLGWMLIIPALLVFIIGFAIPSSISAYWINYGFDRSTLYTMPGGAQLTDALHVVTDAMLPRIGNAFQMVGGVCAAFALAFIFWGIATPPKKKEEIN